MEGLSRPEAGHQQACDESGANVRRGTWMMEPMEPGGGPDSAHER